MEKKINYFLMLSLKEICHRRVAVALWGQTDVIDLLNTNVVENKVEDNIKNLNLPPLLIEEMKSVIKPIGSEIKNWKVFHEVYLRIESIDLLSILQQLHWTVLGTVEYQKTAENLILLKTFDTIRSYKLACIYCLDSYIPALWEQLPDLSKGYYYKEEGPLEVQQPQLEFCWPYILKGEGSRLDNMSMRPFGDPTNFNLNAFEYSACKGNKAATEYFYQRLSNDEKQDSLLRMTKVVASNQPDEWDEYLGSLWDCYRENFPEAKISDTFCYLLSLLNPEQQMDVFQDETFDALVCLLNWPLEDLFLQIAEEVWPFMTVGDYVILLSCITEKIYAGYKLTELFWKFFLRGSCSFRKSFANDYIGIVYHCHDFLDAQDLKDIKIIFGNVDSVDRKKLVNRRLHFEVFCNTILRGDWHLVELCLQEAGLSREEKEVLRGEYSQYLEDIDTSDFNSRQYIWKQFLQYFEENQVKVPNKRKNE